MEIFNLELTRERRRELRNNQTDAERAVWSILRNKQMSGYKFSRQYGIGSYIVDFYCPVLKIVIEVDGGQHYSKEGMEYDHQREVYLKSIGLKVIRFNNLDVMKNLDGVFDSIQKTTPPNPLFKQKRGNAT